MYKTHFIIKTKNSKYSFCCELWVVQRKILKKSIRNDYRRHSSSNWHTCHYRYCYKFDTDLNPQKCPPKSISSLLFSDLSTPLFGTSSVNVWPSRYPRVPLWPLKTHADVPAFPVCQRKLPFLVCMKVICESEWLCNSTVPEDGMQRGACPLYGHSSTQPQKSLSISLPNYHTKTLQGITVMQNIFFNTNPERHIKIYI